MFKKNEHTVISTRVSLAKQRNYLKKKAAAENINANDGSSIYAMVLIGFKKKKELWVSMPLSQ